MNRILRNAILTALGRQPSLGANGVIHTSKSAALNGGRKEVTLQIGPLRYYGVVARPAEAQAG